MMNVDHDKKRIKSINRMLLEVASGNFSYRIERSSQNDELEALIVLANMMTEELGEALRHQNYVNYNESYKHIGQMTFVLDDRFRVSSFNPLAPDILLFKEKEIHGRPLSAFLTEESKPVWQDFQSDILNGNSYNHTLELSFKAKKYFIVPTICSVSTLLNAHHQGSILVTAIETILRSEETENELRKRAEQNKKIHNHHSSKNTLRIVLNNSDLKKIGQVQEYIVNKLDEPNFSLKELARTLGTNEFKLKYGFKQLYGTTVFRYLQEERLRKASLLVQHSKLPLKNISEMTGFKTAQHFSRVFKGKYGYSPSKFRKLLREKNK
ncbi:helix-turn-helix domain-containing protein [Sinomicrobium weinanense]|uniref:Helix-turn-helix domain-containing protein n=1 Tax=Sinomicrobium weinanense TaxID=2842200 RepID=A0A926JRD6_9FLAO|nr:AraC family transcriptional regulator [Sinomicrobium weinanense]MBC9795888.1 helix-turn-helix domain-containing protein [Sinomicrobium weinanense]MBU3124733.1 helix-turn-helix domain-containing protein [Sinomicrobium weinanense]